MQTSYEIFSIEGTLSMYKVKQFATGRIVTPNTDFTTCGLDIFRQTRFKQKATMSRWEGSRDFSRGKRNDSQRDGTSNFGHATPARGATNTSVFVPSTDCGKIIGEVEENNLKHAFRGENSNTPA